VPIPRLSLLALAALLSACANDSVTSPGVHLATGTWGGDRAQVTFSSSETQVTLNCSFGQFAGNVALDPNGRFSIDGTWNRSVGPIQVNSDMPAQLSGQVVGNALTFAIAVNDTIAKQISSLGPVTVIYGKQGTITVCPV
jgi:hypothetical protein